MNQRSGGNLGRRHQIRAINPQVSGPQSRRAAMVHGYDWNGVGQGFLARVKRLSYAGWWIMAGSYACHPEREAKRRVEGPLSLPGGLGPLLRGRLVCLGGLFF